MQPSASQPDPSQPHRGQPSGGEAGPGHAGSTDLFRAGRLADAIAAAQQELRRRPADSGLRAFYAELLIFAGDLDRADAALDAAARGDVPSAAAMNGIKVRRDLLRGESWRRQCWNEGRVPMFLREPSTATRATLRCLAGHRAGDLAAAAAAAREAEALRTHRGGTCDGRRFRDWRDLDDLAAGQLEALSAGGDYLWIAFDDIAELRFARAVAAMDLLWRGVSVTLPDLSTVDLFVPAIYRWSERSADEAIRLGRATTWRALGDDLVAGEGQRCFWLGGGDDGDVADDGEDEVAILDIDRVVFDRPAP